MSASVRVGFMLALLAGCAAISPMTRDANSLETQDANAPMIGPGQRLNLPRIADLGRRILATQLITARGYGQSFVLEVNSA